MKLEQGYKDGNATPVGHFKLEAYYGDIRKARLPLGQVVWNAFADARWKALRIPSNKYYHAPILNDRAAVFSGNDTWEGNNLVVTVGKQMILDRLFGLSGVGAMTRIGVGTSATAAAVGDTTLTGSFFKVYDSTPVRSTTTVTCVTTFATGDANLNWQELGMDNSTTLLNRIAPIGPFNKTSAVSIVVTVTFTQN